MTCVNNLKPSQSLTAYLKVQLDKLPNEWEQAANGLIEAQMMHSDWSKFGSHILV